MKVGIVGVGFMGTTHAAGWAETPAEIVGFTAETKQEADTSSKHNTIQRFIHPWMKCFRMWMWSIFAHPRICIMKWH